MLGGHSARNWSKEGLNTTLLLHCSSSATAICLHGMNDTTTLYLHWTCSADTQFPEDKKKDISQLSPSSNTNLHNQRKQQRTKARTHRRRITHSTQLYYWIQVTYKGKQ